MLLVATVAGAGACGGAQDKRLPPSDLTIASGSRGGVYYEYGRGIEAVIGARLPRLRARTIRTSGSVDNLRRLRDGTADIAFTRADSVLQERDSARSPARVRVVALAKLYDSYVQVVVLASSPIRQLSDLGHRCGGRCRVAVGPSGSGTQLISQRLLTQVGLAAAGAVVRDDRLDIQEGIEALAKRRVDGVVWAGGLPTPAIKRLVNSGTKVRLVDLGEVAARLREDHPDVYIPTRVPGSVYTSKTDTKARGSVGSVSVANYLVARADLPEHVAYRLTALLFEHRSALADAHEEARYLDRRAAIDVYPLELHPGAKRYYADAAG